MIDDFYKYNPYDLSKNEKSNLLVSELIELTKFHKEKCVQYSNFLETIRCNISNIKSIEDVPFFPVRMFKEHDLMSIDSREVFKTMTSSGTTGQKVSKIYLDKETANIQQKVMIKILSDFWGKKRLPMLVIDSPKVLKDRKMFTARGAAIIGLHITAREVVYALNDDMSLNMDALNSFIEKYANQSFIMFGFTFIVWKHLYQELLKNKYECDLSGAWLMTGGGWKKLEEEAISREEFKRKLNDVCKITRFLDHYGMVEQTGCIYAECEYGHLHASNYSDVIIRDYRDFSVCPIGQKGIIQAVSVLPHSYPGHSLLTEDEGVILGEDDCPCGRKGKYIKILGRMKSAELRGCSDTYADNFR